LENWICVVYHILFICVCRRYRIFANSEPEARKSLEKKDLIVKMKQWLVVASGKTKKQKSACVIGELSKGGTK
jgi:hypothetical protein